MPETRHPSRREQYFSSRPWDDISTLVSEVSTKRTSASIHIWANGHYHESCGFKAHSSNRDKVSTRIRVTTYVGLLLFNFFSGPAISVVLALSFLSVLALKFNTVVELYYTQSSIMVAPGALLQLEESFRFRWEVVPNSGIAWRRQLKERDSQQILIFAQMIHANDELSCTLSEASHANRTCC